jgi:uncharacterized hydrophobic protein (TIGR00271 family)
MSMPEPTKYNSFKAFYVYLKFKLRLPRDKDNVNTTIETVSAGATMTGANLWVLVTAIFTASLGLNVNSTAVIIGAMLISPLMGPIMAIGMGVAIHDFGLVYRALKNFALAVFLSIVASSLYFLVSPLKVPGSELLARTTPTVYDVLIAIFGGLAGIIAGSSKLRQSNVIPGVAIATALMPPLCTVGFGVANLNPTYILGALYLFFINSVFISLSTYFIVRLLQYPQVQEVHNKRATQIKRIIAFVSMLALLPSIYLTYQIVRRYIFEEKAKQFVSQEFSDNRRLILNTEARMEGRKPIIEVTILGSEIDSAEQSDLTNRMRIYGLGNAALTVKQGFADVSRRGTIIGSINSSIEANSQAIGRIFGELDQMKSNMNVIGPMLDSTQASMAREVKTWMPDLIFFQLEPVSYFDAAKDSTMFGWAANLQFTKRQQSGELVKLREWLRQRLPGDTILIKL